MAGLGQFVSMGSQLGRIFATDVAEVRLALTDSDLAKLGIPIAFSEDEDNPGPPVAFTATLAGEQHQWRGRIARTEGAIDPATRQVFAIAVIDDPYGAGGNDGTPLAMGLFVDARVTGKPFKNAITLPSTALYGHNTVYVIADDDAIEARIVSVIATDHDTITIAGGVAPGERVAISPLRGAGPGDRVMPADPDEVPSVQSAEPELTASADRGPARSGDAR
jgi:multidrug efflux pump subunit AcrA (membrane-fusion protein)